MLDITNMTKEDLAALVPMLLAKLEEANKPRTLFFKVSKKGAVSVYGFGKWPVTLYHEQWTRLFAVRNDLVAFIKDNRHLLKDKISVDDKPTDE